MKATKYLLLTLYLSVSAPAISAELDEYKKYLPTSIAARIKAALHEIDFSEASMSASPNIMIVSAESTAVTGTTITNRIHYFQRDNLDIWLMRQRQSATEDSNPENWSLISLIVDHSTNPGKAYFLEFAPKPVRGLPEPIPPRVPCLRCHPNGPRLIRPAHASSIRELDNRGLATLKAFNGRISKAGLIDGYSPTLATGEAMLNDSWPGATTTLAISKCKQCHDSKKGLRNSLQLQNASSMLYLTTHSRDLQGYMVHTQPGSTPDMPLDDLPLTAEESSCLKAWFRQKPLHEKCLDRVPQRKKNTNLLQQARDNESTRTFTVDTTNSTIQAIVATTFGSFTVTDLAPIGAIICDQSMHKCSGKIGIEVADATTTILVRDQHLKKLLKTDLFPQASLEISDEPLPISRNSYEAPRIASTLTLAGKTVPVEFNAQCQKRGTSQGFTCTFGQMPCDIRKYGIEPPSFLGIVVDPTAQISGEIVLLE
jgi:polyisoprenoid-binding protein YceI